MGLCWGFALGTKTTALLFGIIPLTTWLLGLYRLHQEKPFGEKKNIPWMMVAQGGLCVAVAACVFSVVSPFSLINFAAFRTSMVYEGGVVAGKISVPYTLQFYQTMPYRFFLQNLPWYLGLPVAILGPAGLIIWLMESLRAISRSMVQPRVTALPFLLASVVYFAYVGGLYAKFIRYMVPLLPFFCLGAAYLCAGAINGRQQKFLRQIVISLALGGTLFWAVAFSSIYTQPNTRTVAREWGYTHFPEGSNLVVEHYDHLLPNYVHHREFQGYDYLIMENFNSDSLEKVAEMAHILAQGDYLILSSRRLWGTISRLPELYPYTAHYYALLFAGDLGYVKVQEFASYPRLGSIIINDDRSEETFQVFDHPVVYIFQNEGRLAESELYRLIESYE